jgi:hypothetical protein
MSEDFLERMSRFTPDAGDLNRDLLLYEAGRRSARPNRGWMTAASLLAASQAVSLVFLLSPARPLPSGLTVVRGIPAAEPPAHEQVTSALDHPGVWSARHKLAELDAEMRPAGDVTLIESGPPLRAFTLSRTSLLD